MDRPVSQLGTLAAYGATQLPRVAWYLAHGAAMRRLAREVRRREGQSARRPRPQGPAADGRRMFADMTALFRQDLANVEAGLYPLPADHDGSLQTLLRRSGLFFRDLPDVHRRRESGASREVLRDELRGKRPNYYLQNFHFQTDGWMSEESAERYDTQVEVLFNGSANAMRRQALPPLHEVFAGRDQRGLRLLDVGCGTGRFLDFAKQAWPRLPCLGLDLSEAYVREARRHLRRWGWLRLVVANGEAIPLADASQDGVTSIFMFHELPPKVRRTIFGEFARVLKPGGRLVIVDSLQRGDAPAYDGLLERFPRDFHEPYYTSYIEEDFGALARACGLAYTRSVIAFVSKVMVIDKPR
ncbi:MAG TPA: class I SAM-dependent methyltransferase [Microvirga sp.]|nr:class I SAM-dependent methyltransferase [Microvirga sp.]